MATHGRGRPLSTGRARGYLLAAALAALAAVTASAAAARPLADSAVLFIGDGTGVAQLELARQAARGEPLAVDRMPYSGLVVTLSLGGRVTDSAAGATALATGQKTENGIIAMTPDGRRLETILERCLKARKSVGIITTDALYGATPASFGSHANSRGESLEIARQMAHSGAQILMGVGKGAFVPKSAGGERTDGKDLIAFMRKAGYKMVFDRQQLLAEKGLKVAGLFEGDEEPTVAEMVAFALPRLAANRRGFFLMVEEARVDWESHGHDAAGAIVRVRMLDEAVAAAVDFARKEGRMLVLVTADHETGGLATSGGRGAALAGVTMSASEMARRLNADRTNIGATLAEGAGVRDLTEQELETIRKAKEADAGIRQVLDQRAGVTWSTTGHTGAPVMVFAFGPGAERFTGELDNTDIPKRTAAILGVAPLGK